MRTAPLSFRLEVAFLDEFLQAQLRGAEFAFRELYGLAEREGFVIGEKSDDFLGEWMKVGGFARPLAELLSDYSRFSKL